jgi:hypothetical protein
MRPTHDNSTASGRREARHRLTSFTTDNVSVRPVESAINLLIRAHTDLRQVITNRLLGQLPPSVSSAAEVLSAQDQLALLHRLSERVWAGLPAGRVSEPAIVAGSTALAVADAIIFRFILAPSDVSPRAIVGAVINLENSRVQLETCLPGIPAESPQLRLPVLQYQETKRKY